MGLMLQSDSTLCALPGEGWVSCCSLTAFGCLTRGRMGLMLQSDSTLCALPGEGWVSCCSLTALCVPYQGKDWSHAAV